MDKRPKVGVGVIVRKDGKFLLMQRKGSHGSGNWCFPGGHLEFNESFEECVIRETMEETGMKIKNVKYFGITNDMFKDEDKHYVTIFIISDYESSEPKIMEPDKCNSIAWFTQEVLPSPLFIPIKNLIRNKNIY
jgi:8-oxo-dGTP diphosphatase